MSFLNPGILGALALVALPLLVHLLRRRKLQVVNWAAMEFLRLSQRRQSRRLRIEELILLLLRMLIIAVAVLAFARPVLRALGIPLLSRNTPVYAVVVLDNSMSMGYRSADGSTSWQRAQQAAVTVATRILKSGDSASVILMSDRPDPLVRAPSFDLRLITNRIKRSTLSDRGTDYRSAAREAAALLSESRTPVKELYWITDDQAVAWQTSAAGAARPLWESLAKSARVTWVSVGPPPDARANLAIAAPFLASDTVTPHLPVRIETRISNFSTRARTDTLVNLLIDGSAAGSARVSVPANGSVPVQFLTTINQPGVHIGSIALADPEHADGLTQDNSAPFVIRVRDRIRLLVADPSPSPDPTHDSAFYIMAAAAPGGIPGSFSPTRHAGSTLSGVALREYDAVIIPDVSRVSPQDARALADYVRAGGGLILFPGADTDAARVNAAFGDAGILPARFGTRVTLPEDQNLEMNPATIKHPALSLFRDQGTLNLASARIGTYCGLTPETVSSDPAGVQVMIRFNNQEPAIVERRAGLGRIVQFATSADARWSQMPLKASFVPLLYALANYVGQGPASRRNLVQGEPITLHLPIEDANRQVSMMQPDGSSTSQPAAVEPNGVMFRSSATRQAGVYRIKVPGTGQSDAFAVALPAAESDTRATEPAAAAAAAGMPAGSLSVAHTPAQLQIAVNHARYGSEIWRPLIWLVFPLLFLESMLAQRFGRRG